MTKSQYSPWRERHKVHPIAEKLSDAELAMRLSRLNELKTDPSRRAAFLELANQRALALINEQATEDADVFGNESVDSVGTAFDRILDEMLAEWWTSET